MPRRWILYTFCLLLPLIALVFTRCGSMNDSGGSGGSATNVNLVINNPDPNSSGTAKAVLIDSEVDQSKTLTKASLNTCTITVSASDISTVTKSFSVDSGASTVTTSLTVSPGSERTFTVDCSDTSATTNDITVGYNGSTTGVTIASGDNTISLSPQFKNLIADDSSGTHFMRLNQENATQTKLTIGFGSSLTDTQKTNLRCVVEFDTSGSRSSLGVIDSNQSNGLTTGSKSGSYLLITGGLSKPLAFLYSSSDAKAMKLATAWGSTDAGNTQLTATFGIRQMKSIIDSDQGGQYALICSLTGASPYDSLPNSGYAKYDLSPNTNESDVASLIDNESSCSTGRSGETCNSGHCGPHGSCISLSASNFTSSNSSVTNLVGPAEGSQATGSSDGVGSAASFSSPVGVCITPNGNTLYVCDFANHTIREVTIATGNVTTLAGSAGSTGTTDATGSSARFNNPGPCVVDPSGTNIYVVETGNDLVRKIVAASGVVTTFAGSGTESSVDGTGTGASFNNPFGITIDNAGNNLYISDFNGCVIRKIVVSSQVVTTIAGSGTCTSTDGTGTSAGFNIPAGLAIDSTDTNLYVAENAGRKIRSIVLASGVVTTIAGSGASGSADGTGTQATFNLSRGLAIDPTDTYLYVGQFTGGRNVRRVEIATGVVTTIAGTGSAGDTNTTGTSASFRAPEFLAINPAGSVLYIPDRSNHKIRQIQIQ